MSLITSIDILDEAKDNFLTYAEEVLTERAIPSAEDGLLSVHRKILWTMEDYLKMNNSSKVKKSASIVGSTLATSYYHGDTSCYGALCKMSQEYLMRYPLIEGEGSLGTQEENGMQAAARYTNAKPSKYADLMMNDYKKNVVATKETYNNEYMEPVVLPSLFPNALVNGKESIGVSLSHGSLPHNLSEVCDAIIAYIQNNNLTTEDIMQYIKGPDFPLPATVINARDIKAAFETGHSKVSLKVRGEYEIKGQMITFTSIPYRVYRKTIKEQINKNIDILDEYIEDFHDASSVGKNKLIFKVKDGVTPEIALNKLFALTSLQTTLSYNMNFIVNGTPKLCSMKMLLKAYADHQIDVLLKATQFDKDKAEARKHVLEGLLAAIDEIDMAIALIRESLNKQEASEKLIEYFDIDEIQAKAILDMKLSKLTKLDKDELEKELKEKIAIIEECNRIINEVDYRNQKLIDKVLDMKKKYGDERRTKLLDLEIKKEEKVAEVIPENVVVIATKNGEIKKIPTANFKVQRKKGKGVKSSSDAVLSVISTNTIDNLLIFSSKGKMYKLLVDNIPTGTNVSKGISIYNLVKMDSDEKIMALTSLDRENNAKYVVFVTKDGLIKKTLLTEYTTVKRSTGIAAIKLKENDSIVNVLFMNEEELILITKEGMSIHFETNSINPIGRTTSGVKSIKLAEGDNVVTGVMVNPFDKRNLSIFTEKGYGKKVPISEFPVQGRVGRGIIVYKPTTASGKIVTALVVEDSENILLIGKTNSICVSSLDVPVLSRTSMGNKIFENEIESVIKI